MPLFEYTCRHCGHLFETLVTGARTPTCPACESTDLDKRFSTFGTRGAGDRSRAGAASRFT